MKINKQTEIKECGLLVIQSLHRKLHHGILNLNELRKQSNMTEQGLNIQSLIDLGFENGLELEGFNVELNDLMNVKNEIMIAVVANENMKHYVIFKFDGKKFNITDPAKGNYSLTPEKFKMIYQGSILTVKKIHYQKPICKEDFSPIKYIFCNINVLVWILFSILVSICLSFVSTLFMKNIFDIVMPGQLKDTLFVLTVGFIAISIIRILNIIFKKYLVKKLNFQIEYELFSLYMNKFKNAEIKDINKITKMDHFRRISLIESSSTFISTSLFVVFNEITTFVISAVILILVSPIMFSITFLAGAITVSVTLIFQLFIKNKYDGIIKDNLTYAECQYDFISNAEEIKETKNKYYLLNRLEESYFKDKENDWMIWKSINFQNLFSNFITLVTPIILTYFAVHEIFNNKLTMGSMLLFLGLFNFFISPLVDLCDFIIKFSQNVKNIKLLSYVFELNDEVKNEKGMIVKKIKDITLKNILFKFDKPLINIKDLEVKKSLKISGKNGSGKSTLLKIIAHRFKVDGEILINGMDSDYYSLDGIREKIFYVSPHTFIPSVTILEYITMNQRKALENFKHACEKYKLDFIFKYMKISLDTKMYNNAENLSSGQKQLVLLLRLFAFDYDLILLDEAFENIDQNILKRIGKDIVNYQDSIFIEISHSKKYITKGKEVDFEKINKSI